MAFFDLLPHTELDDALYVSGSTHGCRIFKSPNKWLEISGIKKVTPDNLFGIFIKCIKNINKSFECLDIINIFKQIYLLK